MIRGIVVLLLLLSGLALIIWPVIKDVDHPVLFVAEGVVLLAMGGLVFFYPGRDVSFRRHENEEAFLDEDRRRRARMTR